MPSPRVVNLLYIPVVILVFCLVAALVTLCFGSVYDQLGDAPPRVPSKAWIDEIEGEYFVIVRLFELDVPKLSDRLLLATRNRSDAELTAARAQPTYALQTMSPRAVYWMAWSTITLLVSAIVGFALYLPYRRLMSACCLLEDHSSQHSDDPKTG